MNKNNYLFTDVGTSKILKKYPYTKPIYDNIRTSVIMILTKDSFDLDITNNYFNYFVTAISNMFYYKLCVLARTKLNVEEEQLIILFGKTLKKRDWSKINDDDACYLARDFGGHIFYEITSNKNMVHYLRGVDFVPTTLIKLIGQSSFGLLQQVE